MTEQTITLTQDELDDMIAKRVARVHQGSEDSNEQAWRRHSRTWEKRSKDAQEELRVTREELRVTLVDRDAWKSRAKFNLAQIQILEKLNDKLVASIERANP